MFALPAECGTFNVAENPDNPNGRKIDLFVARRAGHQSQQGP